MSKITTLGGFSKASLGYKSLQNKFFYLNQATVDTFGLEPRYLMPIVRLADLDAEHYLQRPTPKVFLFYCNEPEDELRGTGALRYIRAVAHHAAKRKKQSGKNETIEEALSKQGGGLWYAPKAQPHKAHIWLRKAFGSVYAPFLFYRASVVDQRCNFIIPSEDVAWPELAAVLTSTLFSFAIEVNGSASLGAGALEAATKKLREFPIVDVRALSSRDRGVLLSHAKSVWRNEKPVDWCVSDEPGPLLRELDDWLLAAIGAPVTVRQLYEDMAAACRSRIAVAADKDRTSKKKTVDDIGAVAEGIAENFRKLIEAKRFPEAFFKSGDPATAVILPSNGQLLVKVERLLGECRLEVQNASGNVLLENYYPGPVADLILQSLMLGRRSLHAPSSKKVALHALDEFYSWFGSVRGRIEKAIRDSSIGTGFEVPLERAIWERLGLHAQAGRRELPNRVRLARYTAIESPSHELFDDDPRGRAALGVDTSDLLPDAGGHVRKTSAYGIVGLGHGNRRSRVGSLADPQIERCLAEKLGAEALRLPAGAAVAENLAAAAAGTPPWPRCGR